jgi:hypothetical protein
MAGDVGPQRIQGYCGLCVARCGTIATVEGGRFTRLDPDPSHPTRHAICAKGRSAPEHVYQLATGLDRDARGAGERAHHRHPVPALLPVRDSTRCRGRRVGDDFADKSIAVRARAAFELETTASR